MQFRNMMLAMGFAAVVLGTGKDASSKDGAAHVGHGSSMKAATVTKGESNNAWYYEGQGKAEARTTEDAKTKTTDHEHKTTKPKEHSHMVTTHVAPPSKETGYKNKDHEHKTTKTKERSDMFTTHVAPPSKETGYKSKEDDKESSYGHMDSGSSKESYHDSGDYSDKEYSSGDYSSSDYSSGDYSSSDYSDSDYSSNGYSHSDHTSVSIGSEETMLMESGSHGHHTSTVSIGPEETMLMESGSNSHHTSTVSIGSEETSLPETTSAGDSYTITDSAGVFNMMATTTETSTHMMTSMQFMIYASETDNMMDHHSTRTTTEIETLSLTYMMEATTAAQVFIETSAAPEIMMNTYSAPPAYTTAPYPATFVANVPSTMATTTVAAVLATGSYVTNSTTSSPQVFTGGSERLSTNSLVAMSLLTLACMLM